MSEQHIFTSAKACFWSPLTSKTASDVAKPHVRLPPPNIALLKMSSQRRPRISVSRPLSGYDSAVVIMYTVASRARFEKEEKEVDMSLSRMGIIAKSKQAVTINFPRS